MLLEREGDYLQFETHLTFPGLYVMKPPSVPVLSGFLPSPQDKDRCLRLSSYSERGASDK